MEILLLYNIIDIKTNGVNIDVSCWIRKKDLIHLRENFIHKKYILYKILIYYIINKFYYCILL